MQSVMRSTAVGVVLAGGSGSRIGGDKGSVRLAGRTLAERALAVLDSVLDDVLLSVGKTGQHRRANAVVVDLHPGRGPLAGLEAALAARPGRPVFVLACDLPLAGAKVVERVLARAASGVRHAAGPAAWLASSEGRVQPLCGLYSAATLEPARRRLEGGDYSMAGLLELLAVTAVPIDDLGAHRLLNVNDDADLARARELVGEA
jgi:molybdopterin-guanine dinucleotide biosynthesis protein A